MPDIAKTPLAEYTTPFKRQNIQVTALEHDNGLNLLEIKIREARRFTMVELDPEIAEQMAQVLLDWATKNKPKS